MNKSIGRLSLLALLLAPLVSFAQVSDLTDEIVVEAAKAPAVKTFFTDTLGLKSVDNLTAAEVLKAMKGFSAAERSTIESSMAQVAAQIKAGQARSGDALARKEFLIKGKAKKKGQFVNLTAAATSVSTAIKSGSSASSSAKTSTSSSSSATAATSSSDFPAPLHLDKSFSLAQFSGESFLNVMMSAGGLKKDLDTDDTTSFKIADVNTFHQMSANFDPSVYKKVIGLFAKGEAGLDQLLGALNGQSATPATLSGILAQQMDSLKLISNPKNIGLAAVSAAPLIALCSGAGTSVQLDRDNYYYNYGYSPGSLDAQLLAKDVKTGRSFGASAQGHKALDASDVYYLTELGTLLKKTTNAGGLFQNLLQLLVRSDVSGYGRLDAESQMVSTDFAAIYTAELDRNLMTQLKTHSWEDDLAEVTFLSAYGVKAGLVRKNGKIVAGTPVDYYGKGKTGSGIGETRKDRQALQLAVSKAEAKLNPSVVSTLAKLIGAKAGTDMIHGFMVYLNNPKNQDDIKKNANDLINAFAAFLQHIYEDEAKITTAIKG